MKHNSVDSSGLIYVAPMAVAFCVPPVVPIRLLEVEVRQLGSSGTVGTMCPRGKLQFFLMLVSRMATLFTNDGDW